MPHTNRSEFIKEINSRRNNIAQGLPTINPSDNSTSIGDELSSLAYLNTNLPKSDTNIETPSQVASDRNGFQRAMDTIESIGMHAQRGFLGFFDSLGDLALGAVGSVGNAFGADTSWAKDAINYDWQSRVMELTNGFSATDILSGDAFKQGYASNWVNSWQNVSNAQQAMANREQGSFISEAPELAQNIIYGSAEAIGQMLPQVAFGLGLSTSGMSGNTVKMLQMGMSYLQGAGGGMSTAIGDGADWNEANISSAISGLIEMGTEKFGDLFGEKTINGIATDKILKRLTAKELVKVAVGEGTEEAISELLSPLAKLPYTKYDSVGDFFNKEVLTADMGSNMLTSFIGGAVGGVAGSSMQTQFLASRYGGSENFDIVNKGVMLGEYSEQSSQEARKGVNADQEKIADLEAKKTQLYSEFKEELKALEETNPKASENIMLDLTGKSDVLKKYAEIKNKTGEQLTESQRTETLKSMFNSRMDYVSSNAYEQERSRMQEIANAIVNDERKGLMTIDIVDDNDLVNGAKGTNGFIVDGKNIIVNRDNISQFYGTISHELFSHAIIDGDSKVFNDLYNTFDKNFNEEFHKNDTQLLEQYEGEGNKVLKSERLANFIQQYITDFKSFNKVLGITDKSSLKGILNKVKSYFAKNKNEVSDMIIKQINNALNSIDTTAITNESTTDTETIKYSKKTEKTEKTEKAEKTVKEKPFNANATKDYAQHMQDSLISVKSSREIYDSIVDGISESFGQDIKIEKINKKSQEIFEDYNRLLNKPDKFYLALEKVVDDVLNSNVEYQVKMIAENDSDIAIESNVKKTLSDHLKEIGFDVKQFKEDSIKELANALNEKSEKTKIAKIKLFARQRIEELKVQVNQYRDLTHASLKSAQMIDRIMRKISKHDLSVVNKPGDKYYPELQFYKQAVGNKALISKTAKGISPKAIDRVLNGFKNYTEESMKDYRWIRYNPAIDEDIKFLTGIRAREGTFDEKKVIHFPNRALTIDEVNSLNRILGNISHDITEMTSEVYLKEHEMMAKGDSELQVYANSFNTVDNGKIISFNGNAIQRELDYASSPDAIFSNVFGSNSDTYKMVYEDIMHAYSNQQRQDVAFMKEYEAIRDGADKKQKKHISKLMGKRVNIKNANITYGELLTIYGYAQTASGLATLQDGGAKVKDAKGNETSLKLNSQDLIDIEDMLPSELKDIANRTIRELYSDKFKEYKKKADIKNFGFTNVIESELYMPSPKDDVKAVKNGANDYNPRNLNNENLSINQQRKQVTSKAMIINDFDKLMMSYVGDLTDLGEMTQTKNKLSKFLNQYTTNKNGNRVSRYSYMKEVFGSKFMKMFNYYLDQLSGNLARTVDVTNSNKMFSNIINYTLAGNISVMLKQTASLPTILYEVKTSSWLKALGTGIGNLKGYGDTKQWLIDNSGILANRWKNLDAVRAETLSTQLNGFAKTFGIGMEKMDEGVIILYGLQSARYEAESLGFGKVGTKTNDEQAIKILERIVLNTQSNSVQLKMSMNRAGVTGMARKMLSYFTSDLQNKVSKLNTLLNEKKYAKKRAVGIDNLISNIDEKITAKENEISALKANKQPSGELTTLVTNFDETSSNMRLENELSELKEQKANFEQIKANNTDLLENGNGKEWAKYLTGAVLSAFIVAGIDELVRRIYGKEGWTDIDLDNFTKNVIIESTLSNLPYLSSFMSAFEYGTDISAFELDGINQAITSISEIANMIQTGDFKPYKIAYMLANLGGMFTGIPFKNLYNIVVGIYKNINPDGYKLDALVKGYSDTYIASQYRASIENNNKNAQLGDLKTLMVSYKVSSSSDQVLKELNTLYASGYNALPKNYMTEYTNEDGETIKLTASQVDQFRNLYEEANSAIESVMSVTDYSRLTQEQKSKAIKRVYDSYYAYAKAKVIGTKGDTKISQLLVATNGRLNIGKLASQIQIISTIEATKLKTKKELVLDYLNKLKGYSKKEKLCILYMTGYSLSDTNRVVLNGYLNSLGAKNLIEK